MLVRGRKPSAEAVCGASYPGIRTRGMGSPGCGGGEGTARNSTAIGLVGIATSGGVIMYPGGTGSVYCGVLVGVTTDGCCE